MYTICKRVKGNNHSMALRDETGKVVMNINRNTTMAELMTLLAPYTQHGHGIIFDNNTVIYG